MAKKEDIEVLKAYLQEALDFHKLFYDLSPEDLSPYSQEIDSTETVARIADKYGFDGALFRNLTSDRNLFSSEAFDWLEKVINTIPKITATIENHTDRAIIPEEAELLTVPQVAILLGWGESVVRQRDREGLLPMPIRTGGTIQWSRNELKSWIDAKCPPRQKWELSKIGKGN
ncbi:MAG: hypothetical protein C0397_19475 [Odoribacter sp.]|nr:hypothetical protein [Odoribacter sp.]